MKKRGRPRKVIEEMPRITQATIVKKFFADPEIKKIFSMLKDNYYAGYYAGAHSNEDFLCYEDRKLVQKSNDRKIMFDAGFEAVMFMIETMTLDLQTEE